MGASILLTLTQGDLNVDNTNDQLTVIAVAGATHGNVVLNADGTITTGQSRYSMVRTFALMV